MRRLPLLVPAALLALGLTACGGGGATTSPEPADNGSAPASTAPQTSTAPEGGAGAPSSPAADLVLTGAVGDLSFEASDELPAAGGLEDMMEQITIEPAECKEALTSQELSQGFEDVEAGRAALSLAQSDAEVVTAVVSERVQDPGAAQERLETCGEMTMDIGTGQPIDVSLAEVDVPEVEGASDVIGLSTSVDLPGTSTTSIQYLAVVRDRQVLLALASTGESTTDSLDAAYTAQVEKIVAAQ